MTIPNKRMQGGDIRLSQLTNQNSDWFLGMLKLWLGPKTTVLEFGTASGVSARRFASMFPLGLVATCDIQNHGGTLDETDRASIHFLQGDSISGEAEDLKKKIDELRQSTDAVQHWDLVYHDSVHTKEGLTNELINFYHEAKYSKMVGGHDYSPMFPGVIEGVCEFFNQPPHIVLGDTSWFYFVDQL